MKAFAAEVRRHDPHRFITSGNSCPRPSAWHQWRERSWSQDTEAQHTERLLLDHPRPLDTVSIHVYEDAATRFGRRLSVAEYLRSASRAAKGAGKALFVGEFGARAKSKEESRSDVRARLRAILSAIEDARVPLAALWVYDFDGQRTTWNVARSNARAWQLDEIAAANRRIAPKP